MKNSRPAVSGHEMRDESLINGHTKTRAEQLHEDESPGDESPERAPKDMQSKGVGA